MTREQMLMARLKKVADDLSSNEGFVASLQASHDKANMNIAGKGGTNSSSKLLEYMEADPFFLSRCVDD